MKSIRLKSLRLLLACLCILFLCGQSHPLWAQEPDAQNYSQVMSVPRQKINDWLKSEIVKSGGDFDHQRYHFIVGFSTGHYGQDPVHAIAMRRLAFGLLNNSMAVGDKVTSVSWEMRVWDKGHPSTLSEDPATRKEFVDSVPYSTAQNSKGGHDMEHALYDTLTEVVDPAEAKSTIIIMLTNSNQSQGPQGENVPLFGMNNKQLADAIQKLDFRTPPTRASFELQGKNGPLKVDVTALFPQKLESLSGAPTTSRFPTFSSESWQPEADRPAPTETLPNPAAAPAAAPNGGTTTNSGTTATNPDNGTHTIERNNTIEKTVEKQPGTPWLLYLLAGIVLIVLILVGLRALSNRPAPTPKPVVAAVPIGRPLPGAIEVNIGTQASVLMPLTTISQWKLLRAGDTLVLQSDQPEPPKDSKAEDKKEPAPAAPTAPTPPAGRPVATLDFDEKRRLRVNAEPDTQFHDIKGFNITESNNRQLNIAPGEKLICRVATSEAPTATRLELNYNKDRRA